MSRIRADVARLAVGMIGGVAMKTAGYVGLVVVASVVGMWFNNSSTAAPEGKAALRVSVDDIGRKVVLVGRLGQPLGTMMTVNGKWGYPDQSKGPTKIYDTLFTVSHVNGVELDQPLVFYPAQVNAVDKQGKNVIPAYKEHKSLDGVSWTLRAFETGKCEVTPSEYWDEIGSGERASAPWQRYITSGLVGVLQPAKATDQSRD